MADEFMRGTIGQRGIHLLEEILRSDEQSAITILECLEQQTRGKSRLPDSGWTYKAVGPIKTIFMALGMNSSSASSWI